MSTPNLDWARRLGLRYPIVQAGMGGGCVTADLAAAVSLAGGLGTVGTMPVDEFAAELAATRIRCKDHSFAANLLMPFVKPGHVDACLEEHPAVVVRFYGHGTALVQRLQSAGIAVWQQVGDLQQARRALDDGVDVLIAQGNEAGGHLASGQHTRANLMQSLRANLGANVTLLAAGGIHDAASARTAMQQGSDGVVAGTRFLLTPQANIHPAYQQRLLQAQHTLQTRLFGLGWTAPHRVADNAATRRWIGQGSEAPAWLRGINRLLEPSRQLLPLSMGPRLVRMQRLALPFYSPFLLLPDMPAAAVEVTPLYAGSCVAHINTLQTAAEVVAELAQGCGELPDLE